VIDEHRTPEEADHQARPAVNEKTENAKDDGGNEFELVQPHQLGMTSEIGNFDKVGRGVASGKNPPDMTVQEALVPG